jgi:hypothetical protein
METATQFTEEIKARVPLKLKRLVEQAAQRRMMSESDIVREAVHLKLRRRRRNGRKAA